MSKRHFFRFVFILLYCSYGQFVLADAALKDVNLSDQELDYLQQKKQITMCIDPDSANRMVRACWKSP